MPPREPPRLILPAAPGVVVGLPDDAGLVANYFEAFDWDGEGHDPDVLSAEDFLSALG